MSQDTENFEQLRRLLKLKRYEQPPPRYFNDFSSQVIARVKRGERGDGYASVGRMLWEAPWLQRIWAAFEAKPILAGAFGLAVCATLITGVIYSERTDLQPVALIPGAEASISGPMDSPMEIATAMAENRTALINPAAGLEGSLSNSLSALPTDGPLFDLRADPASLTIPGPN